MKEKLLEDLAEQNQVFISDLKDEAYFQVILHHLLEIPSDNYTVEEWNYALSYLFNKETIFQTRGEILSFIEAHDGK